MTGLLYKDYVATKAVAYVWSLLFVTVGIGLLSLCAVWNDSFAILNGFLCMGLPFVMLIIVAFVFPNELFSKDEGKSCKQYILSLPIGRNEYVASKYVYLLISYYVVISCAILWTQMYNIAPIEMEEWIISEENGITLSFSDMVMLSGEVAVMVTTVMMISSSFEMPLYLLFGKEGGNRVRTSIVLAVSFAVIVYFFFGDLTIMEKIGIMNLIYYCMQHQEVVTVFVLLLPFLSGGLLYLSYRISLYFFEKKEVAKL